MKNKLLPLFGLAFVAAGANAQSWTAPTITGQDLVEGDSLYLYNVDAQMFLCGGNWWGTHTSLSAEGLRYIATYDADNAAYTLMTASGTKAGKYVFRDNDASCYIDMASQGHNYWAIRKQESGYYRIQSAESDATFGNAETAKGESYSSEFFGWDGDATSSFVWANMEPDYTDADTGFKTGVDWQFVNPTEYESYAAKKALYDQLVASEAYSSLDVSAYAAIYTSGTATVEEITAAAAELKEKVYQAQVYSVLEGASEDDPKDATSLLVNPTFDTDASGWTNTFVSGTNATNVGYQSASYTNGEVTINHFIEAWTWAQYGAAAQSIGDGELSQTLQNLPAGKYKLTVDIIACNQPDYTITTGVQLFAHGGDIDKYQEVVTQSEKPEHFEVEFVSTGGDITMGLRTVSSTANWIAADNFTLTYYGATVDDPYKVALDETVATYEAKYADLSAVKANGTVKEAYSTALENAKAATEDYLTYQNALTDAVAALEASVKEYASAATQMTDIENKMAQAESKSWGELADNLADYKDELQSKYESGDLTSEEIAAISATVNNYIGEYISNNAQAGDDVTMLLTNPGFDKDFSGWDVDDTKATPAWGGMNLENDNGTGAKLADLNSGNAEVYHAAFDISQTVKNMPRGLYTLSCQAFERDDNGAGVDAELYAVVNGEEQTVKIMNLYDEHSEEILYQNGTSTWDTSLDDNGLGYVPNTMCGANVYFAAGYYKNKFSIVVTEQTDIKVGIRTASTGDWVLFDDFKLVYEGGGADVYAPVIADLIEKVNAADGGKTISAEADTKRADAITAGENATTEDDCIAAMAALNEAITFVENSVTHVEELQYLYDLTTGYRMEEVSSSEESYNTTVDEIGAALENGEFETEATIDTDILALKSGFTKYVQYDNLEATEDAPADISSVILTPSSVDFAGEGSKYGWEGKAAIGLGNGCSEIFNQSNVDFTQTIYGLAPGYYRLNVQGFYRPTGYATTVDAVEDVTAADTLAHNVDIFAGDVATRMRSIMSDAEAYNTLVEGATEGAWAIPSSMESANNAFENELYKNTLQFQVVEGQTEVTIGVRKNAGITDDWTIFDNWTLEYIGTAEPTTDPTTSVKSVDGAAGVVSTRVYSLDGTQQSRLLKGVNIIKTTLSDGTVRVSKVLVR